MLDLYIGILAATETYRGSSLHADMELSTRHSKVKARCLDMTAKALSIKRKKG